MSVWPARTRSPGDTRTSRTGARIRAEIVAYDDLIKAGGMTEAKKQGTVRMEGKTYIVKDGDVCHFLFNV